MINKEYAQRVIRAAYDENSITVYQAYNKKIAQSAVAEQTFVEPPFKIDRMTWIKPSFLWMMYRSGWASKKNQEHILAIKIKREGFEWALAHSCLSHYDANIHDSREAWQAQLKATPVRIQWDPEKDIKLNALDYRSIQIGLSKSAVKKYISDWILEVKDITSECKEIKKLIDNGQLNEAHHHLPVEEIYTIEEHLRKVINMD